MDAAAPEQTHAPRASWACPSCGVSRTTAFCSACGERPIAPRDLTLHGIIALTFAALSPVDGRVLRTLRALVTRPGSLTAAFQRGLRKPYVGPLQIFLLANLFFFAVQTAGRMNVFTRPLARWLSEDELGSSFSRGLVEKHLTNIGQTVAQYAPFFDQAVAVNAKSLVGLMVPIFALLISVVFWRRTQPLAVNFVFSLHFYAVVLLLFCVPLIGMEISPLLGGPAVPSSLMDDAFSVTILFGCIGYLYAAIGPVYGATGWLRIVQAFTLTVAAAGILLVYRILLLPITLYTT